MKRCEGIAWLVLALVACGNDHGGRADAPGGVDADVNAVTVAVTAFGVPAPGVQVYFQDADSALVAGGSALTGSDGTASAPTPAGGFVTVVAQQYLDTIAGVEPGDMLHLEIAGRPAPAVFAIDVTAPTDPTVGVTGYQFYSTCSTASAVSSTAAARLTSTGCAGGVADMLVTTTDDSGRVVDSLYEAGVAVSGDPVTVTGSYVPVPMLSDVITDVPAAPSIISAGVTLVTPHGQLYGVGSSSLPPPTGSATSLSFAWPTIPGAEALTVFDVLTGPGGLAGQYISQYGSSSAQPVTVDFAADRLRGITGNATFDVPTRTITWALDSTGVTPDVDTAFVEITRGSGSAAATWAWQILSPGGDEVHIVLPTLPSDPFDFNIRPGDSVDIGVIQGATSPGGVAALRSLGMSGLAQELFDRTGTTVFSVAYGGGASLRR